MSRRREASPHNSTPHALTFRVMRLVTPLPSRTDSLPFSIALTDPDPHTLEEQHLQTNTNTDIVPFNTDTSLITQHVPILENCPPWEAEGAPCGVGALIKLPSSFGSIYASETFRCFISVFNRYPKPIQDVTLSIYMQTSSQQRKQLIDTSDSPRPLTPRAAINNVIKIRLPEFGVHVLVCSATYRDPISPLTNRTLRQFFKLNVLPSLEPTLNVRTLYGVADPFPLYPDAPTKVTPCVQYLVDLRVLNSLPVPIYKIDATFHPKHPFQVRTLTKTKSVDDITKVKSEQTDQNELKLIRRASMGVGDARHFMFQVYRYLTDTTKQDTKETNDPSNLNTSSQYLMPDQLSTHLISNQTEHTLPTTSLNNPISIDLNTSNSSEDNDRRMLGQISVSWRSALGEVGYLENILTAYEPLQRQNEVDVFIYAVPENVQMHHPFTARCVARNNANTPKRLYLQVRRDLVGEIVPVGVSGVSLGEVEPGRTAKCAITMLPLVRGTHNISGVRVVDVDTNISYKADPPSISVT